MNLNSTLLRFWRAFEVLAWTAFFLFAVLVLVLRFWVLPDIERYREDIVARVTQTVGQPVKIAGIEAGWLGLRPQISLTDVRIYDVDGREALSLPIVENVVSWRSLIYRELRLHSLVIQAPRLTVRRDAEGALHVAGMKLSGGGNDPRFTDWLLGQAEIEIRDAEIEWRDEKRGAPPLALTQVNFKLRNAGDSHAVGISARPPAEVGSTVELRALLDGASAADLALWSGRLYAVLGDTDLAAWRAWVDYPIELRRGHGALRLWATLERGEARAATADVALVNLAARLGADAAPLELESVEGRLRARAGDEGYELSGRGLTLVAARGPALPKTDFQLAWKPARARSPETGTLEASVIDFRPLAHLAESLPVPAEVRRRIAELAPRGQLAEAKLEWQGPLAEPERYRARARFTDLALEPWGAVPGFAGLSGSFEATQSAGRLNLTSRRSHISLPKVFPDPRLEFDSISGHVEWERAGERGFTVRVSSVSFANPDAAGQVSGAYTSDGSGPGRVDLSASLSRADGRRTWRYLPHADITGPKTREWLASSILEGQSNDVQLRLRGDLARFPFVDPSSGQFLVTAHVKHGGLNYGSAWPSIYDIEAELRFERERMEITGRSGTIFGTRLSNVRVTIPNLDTKTPVLTVTGQAEGPTSEFLRFVDASPVKRMTGGLTGSIVATGSGRLRLKLDLPLADLPSSRVAGEYEIAANNVVLMPQLPPVERAVGKIAFTDAGFSVQDVRGRLFGGSVAISGGSRAGGVEIVARGDATVAALSSFTEHPWRRFFSGAAPYTASVSLADGITRVSVESSLRGVASALPPPLEKAAPDALPLRVDIIPSEGGARERVSVMLGSVVAAEFLRQRQGDGVAVQRASIAFSPQSATLRLPERPGTLIYGALPALDVDRWLPLFSSGDSAAAATNFDLQLGQLDVYGKRVHNVAMKAGADAGGWSASLTADEIAGELTYHGERGGRLVAKLAHFTMPEDTPSALLGSKAERKLQPKELPAIDFVAERFSFRGKQFGRVEIAAQRAGEDWRIDKLAMVNPDSTLRGSGLWAGAGAVPRCTLEFELETSDSGKFLGRVGYPDLVKGGKAKMDGTLSWLGEPASIDYPSLSGKVKMEAENGQFLEIDPGAGKLVSLMSLQMLPRRITLDFSDVFSKGFQFDRISAAGEVQKGVLRLSDFQMRGSAAEVQMAGSADLAAETQNLKVRVVPSLGDTAAAVLGLATGPGGLVVGGIAAFAQRVLKNPLGQFFSYNYSITGSWTDPKVAKIGAEPQVPRDPIPEAPRP